MCAQGTQPLLPSEAGKLVSHPIAQSLTESTAGHSLGADNAQQVTTCKSSLPACLHVPPPAVSTLAFPWHTVASCVVCCCAQSVMCVLPTLNVETTDHRAGGAGRVQGGARSRAAVAVSPQPTAHAGAPAADCVIAVSKALERI